MLILAATPIGHIGDASPRLVETLATADIIAAEDTRRITRLLAKLEVETNARLQSYFEGNEEHRTAQLLDELRGGATVVVVSDAGMPSVSDPGYRIVTAAIDAGITVTAVPGPSAVVTALAVSGLPVDRFTFEGFLPRKAGERDRLLADLADQARTMVFFESPHRTRASLVAMREAWDAGRRAAVCRELTKMHEEVARGSLTELIEWCDQHERPIRGEVTIVAEGARVTSPTYAAEDVRAMVDRQEAAGLSRRDAIALVAQNTGLPKRTVYAAAHS